MIIDFKRLDITSLESMDSIWLFTKQNIILDTILSDLDFRDPLNHTSRTILFFCPSRATEVLSTDVFSSEIQTLDKPCS